MVRGANPHWVSPIPPGAASAPPTVSVHSLTASLFRSQQEREFVFTTSFPDDSGGFKAGPFGEDRRARKVPWLASSAAAEEGRSAVTSTLHHVRRAPPNSLLV